MDLNLVVLSGRLAAPPELREVGRSRLARYLMTVTSTNPTRRLDVVPVTVWDPPDEIANAAPTVGMRLLTAASVQRRFWASAHGRRSRLEVVASHIEFRERDED
ncbi:MAG: single-stranded DNA-binding protein [Acidimicrobiia bacterium]